MTEKTAKLREQASRGEEARRISESPLVKEFFQKIKEHVRGEWERSDPDAKDEREHQWRLFQAVGLVEECFKSTVQTGEFARKELIQQQAKGLDK